MATITLREKERERERERDREIESDNEKACTRQNLENNVHATNTNKLKIIENEHIDTVFDTEYTAKSRTDVATTRRSVADDSLSTNRTTS